ncbi:hypothetical protein D9756_008500 [Leucocoprinus leucothites]|uniref:Uncharacterized protein n=1 Tax=Leucocoprinus leucothites TaxID=201217 RepID=A0A8H5CZ66_9AGAR|nr:hypothetical protein D9756_008500 [Leucoagaricus leucothites]
MGAPTNGQTAHDAFPHSYIRDNGYRLSPGEEQIICTVYQKTPAENRENLRSSLMSYIDWRCSTLEDGHRQVDRSAGPGSLHLCTHMDKSSHGLDKEILSEFSTILENDGITRLDLLWDMRPYRKWFDATPGTFTIETAA